MKKFVGVFFFLALAPLAHAAKLLPAIDTVCLNASEAALSSSSSLEADFYVDQNGKCGSLAKKDIIAPKMCMKAQTQCKAALGQTFSNLYQIRANNGLMEIIYAGCGCYENVPDTTIHGATQKISQSFSLQNASVVACSTTELVNAINAANLSPNSTVTLSPNCTYLFTTPTTSSEALPPITGKVTVIGGENTVIARSESAAMFRIFTVNNGATLTVKNLQIKNGFTSGLGGGILNDGTLTLERVTMTNNKAGNGGGFSTTSGATTSVLGSEFVLNTTTSVGGGAFINFGTTTASKSRFRENTSPINGGAINTQPNGTTTISSSDFSYNTSGGLGGTLSNLGILNIDHSQIQENTGTSGGAIATGNSNVNLSVMKIVNNNPDNCSPLNTIEGCVD